MIEKVAAQMGLPVIRTPWKNSKNPEGTQNVE
jgi:hypothetical protein